MSGILDKIREHPAASAAVVTFRTVYGWISENLWPVYSTGAIVSVVCILAASQEKQILADHLYGNNKAFASDSTEIVNHATKMLEDEISYGIKQDVFAMRKAEFEREYEERR